MKKVKLICSDLHLGVGKILEGGETNSLEEFYYDEQFAEFLNYYTVGEFKDTEVELVLNGDIFNFLQIDYNGHYLAVITETISLENLKGIVKGHPVFFKALREFVENGKNSITFIVGNHDQGMLWPEVRSYLNQIVGAPIRYKNLVYFFEGVHIEHGHMHEAANRLDPRRFFLKHNVAEPILNLPMGSQFFVDFVLKVKLVNPYIDKVRPFTSFIRWGLVFDTLFTLKTLVGLLFYFGKRILVPDPRRGQWSLKNVLKVFAEGAVFPDLDHAARKILNDEKIHTVIFGHSHVYQYRKYGKDKEYFNTGTWTELTSLDMVSLGKITKLTYVLIEYPDQADRPRGRLKEWRGFHRVQKDVDVS
ncbi:MAG: hypothetical protein COT74_07690 [Bdellovibrionales bacterium CG10_big_fil_rev_8_21_14_0_10_45_34]|nr:MAG: hypothetical protein COT74_07690 [Bdellovibrionales bacterium CG10_big_fil_rev_8_21_14_0_10_45_34]